MTGLGNDGAEQERAERGGANKIVQRVCATRVARAPTFGHDPRYDREEQKNRRTERDEINVLRAGSNGKSVEQFEIVSARYPEAERDGGDVRGETTAFAQPFEGRKGQKRTRVFALHSAPLPEVHNAGRKP